MCLDVTAGIERELGPMSNDSASLQLMRGFADSDGHIVSSGAAGDQETNYTDGVSGGHRRKVVIDGIFNRCFLMLHTNYLNQATPCRSRGYENRPIPFLGWM